MAFTKTNITQGVFGNMRVSFDRVTPDAAEGTVQIVNGPGNIIMSDVSSRKNATFVASGNTAQSYVNWVENAGTTGTVAAGQLGFSGCVANNILNVVTYFR